MCLKIENVWINHWPLWFSMARIFAKPRSEYVRTFYRHLQTGSKTLSPTHSQPKVFTVVDDLRIFRPLRKELFKAMRWRCLEQLPPQRARWMSLKHGQHHFPFVFTELFCIVPRLAPKGPVLCRHVRTEFQEPVAHENLSGVSQQNKISVGTG